MSVNRKEFLKKACIAGVCMCGFSLPVLASGNALSQNQADYSTDDEKIFIQNWIGNLLKNLDADLDKSDLKSIVKKNSVVHFNDLNMDEVLAGFIGQPEQFLAYISEKWGWNVNYNKATKTVIANENKTHCVCPVVNSNVGFKSAVICHCSEGFAEKMFSTVFGAPVSATVISSVLRGDATCVYKIIIS